MIEILEYKGHAGSVELSEEDGLLCGRLLGVRGLYSYEGESVGELIEDFHEAVEGLLADEGEDIAIASTGEPSAV